MTNSPSGDDEMRLVPRDKTPPPRLHAATGEDEQRNVVVETPPEPIRTGRFSFFGSLILITLAFSIGFSYLLAKRWPRRVAAPDITAAGAATAEAPVAVAASATPVLFPINPDLLHVTAIALGHSRVAIVNGQRVAEGESLAVKTSAGTATVRVDKIEDGVVRFAYGDESIEARLNPPKMQKKPPP